MGLIYTALLCFLVGVYGARAEQLSTIECENLGFSGLALCSDCRILVESVKDQELVSECLSCCTEDSDDGMSKKINHRVISASHADQFQRSLKGILVCTLGKPECEEQQKLQFLEFSYLFDFLQKLVGPYMDRVNGRSRRPMA